MPLRRWSLILVATLLLSSLAACGEPEDTNIGVFQKIPDPPIAGGGQVQALTVDSAEGAALAFVQTTLEASTGTIEVTFNNLGALPHNWTLVKPEDEQKASDEAVTNAPQYTSPSALAQTETINGAQVTKTTFQISEPGTYSYICTFPGHYAGGMKGTITIAQGSGAPAGAGTPLTSNSGEAASVEYLEKELTVKAGSVSLTFNNKGALPHNWTLVQVGDEQKASDEAITDSTNYASASALAQTKLLMSAGQSDTINFTVEPGTYSYICTFPGHLAQGMKGTLIVE